MVKIALWIFLLLLAGTSESNRVPRRQLFYQLFTPTKIAELGIINHDYSTISDTLLTFTGAPNQGYRLLKLPLVRQGVIPPNTNLVVKMVVGVDTSFGEADCDPYFVISDGVLFVGGSTLDRANYVSSPPCVIAEGTSGQTYENLLVNHGQPKPFENYYPGRFEILLSLSYDKWASCYVPLDGGFSREKIYQNTLNPQNGLFVEFYADHGNERVGIKYIEVTILQESE